MNHDDTEIGRPLYPGERWPAPEQEISMLIDSEYPHEIIFLSRGEGGDVSEIINAGAGQPYSVERYEDGHKVTICFEHMLADRRYVLGAYVSSGRMPAVMATIDEPRAHFALPSKGKGAVAIFEFYHKGEWRMKSYGGWYSDGLQAMISA